MTKMKELLFERGDRIYIVGPVAPMQPSNEQIEEYAFAGAVNDAVKRMQESAPNERLGWFGGHYVESDTPNKNGAMWTAKEVAIKALTPMFMPVTVMHDPRTAVGLIADVSLKTPENSDVPRSKIETALAIWKHRFPEAYEEAVHNYEAGTLMQSMECFAPDYSCSECGSTYHKMPKGQEQSQWCAHLKASNPSGGYENVAGDAYYANKESAAAVRILRNVCFTGTGLIFGSRGARGADPSANLEAFAEEVAEFHEKRTEPKRRRTKRKMDPIEISKSEYDELTSKARELDSRPTQAEFDAEKKRADDAEAATEAAEAEKVKAEETAADLQKKVDASEEDSRKQTLASERLETLGDGFKSKLGDKTKANLERDAAAMSDEDWKARTEELSETLGVELDAKKDATEDGKDVFDREEVARSNAGDDDDKPTDSEQSPAMRSSVIGGLFAGK